MTKDERIEKALDTLAELCEAAPKFQGDAVYEQREAYYGRRAAAEEILRHYREADLLKTLKHVRVDLTVNGAIPVRPMVRQEL